MHVLLLFLFSRRLWDSSAVRPSILAYVLWHNDTRISAEANFVVPFEYTRPIHTYRDGTVANNFGTFINRDKDDIFVDFSTQL